MIQLAVRAADLDAISRTPFGPHFQVVILVEQVTCLIRVFGFDLSKVLTAGVQTRTVISRHYFTSFAGGC
jgi:hypothetical protein